MEDRGTADGKPATDGKMNVAWHMKDMAGELQRASVAPHRCPADASDAVSCHESKRCAFVSARKPALSGRWLQ